MPKTYQESGRGLAVIETANTPLAATTTETPLFTYTVVAGRMTKYQAIRWKVEITFTSVLAAPQITIRLRFGNSMMVVVDNLTVVLGATNRPIKIEGMIVNCGATNVQFADAAMTQSASGPVFTALASGSDAKVADWTEDTTQDKNFAVSAQFGGLTAGASINYRLGMLEIF